METTMEKKMQITIYHLRFRVWGLGIEMAMQESAAKSTIFSSRMWCVGVLMQKGNKALLGSTATANHVEA